MTRRGFAALFCLSLIGAISGMPDLFRWFLQCKSPILIGIISDRRAYRYVSIQRTDFTIVLAGSNTVVHAMTAGSLRDKVPERVRFRYRPDLSDDVFLLDFETHPLWQVAICGFGAILFGTLLPKRDVRPTIK